MSSVKSTIPDNISEEYYQINPDILASFPKYRPPVDLFEFKEDIAALTPYIHKGNRLTNEQIEEIHQLCQGENLFVSRSDHPIYSKHICKQLDLVLVDKNLKEGEITDIFVQAFQIRLEAFYDQPVQVVFDALYRDLMVLTEYLMLDCHRIKSLTRRLLKEHTLVNHSINCGIMGLWLYIKARGGCISKRRELDRATLAFFLHDLGMSKIPMFVRTKTAALSQDDKSKINMHPIVGAKLATKLGLTFPEIQRCILEHHERLDGSGYPRKISGDEFSKLGRMCAVADSFCAMITERPYAEAKDPVPAAQELLTDQRYEPRATKLLFNALSTKELTLNQYKPKRAEDAK